MKIHLDSKACGLIWCAFAFRALPIVASSYFDYSKLPLPEIIKEYSRLEQSMAADTNSSSVLRYAGGGRAMMVAIGNKGDRAVLPFLEGKSLSTNVHEFIREGAANAYVKIADLDESVEFMNKAFKINENKGFWRSTLTPQFLGKMEAAITSRSIPDETMGRLLSVLVSYTQSTSYSREAAAVDEFLVKHCDGYLTSVQRLSLWDGILAADRENALKRKHYLPIKETIEALPKKQRVDLRERFPDLPPLPADKGGRPSVPVWIGVGVAVVIGVAALLRFLLWKRRATP